MDLQGLNPFEIRAWLAQYSNGEWLVYGGVLIPLKSGHGWHTKQSREQPCISS